MWREFADLHACPRCKRPLRFETDGFAACDSCAGVWPALAGAPDFRPTVPDGCPMPAEVVAWRAAQQHFEHTAFKHRGAEAARDMEGCREVYGRVDMSGLVLDLGGSVGLVRDLLPRDISYVCLDPMAGVVEVAAALAADAEWKAVHPSLGTPFCHILSSAERLPLASSAFDWVNARSMIDHCYDPYEVLKEIYRVLKPGGRLLLGVTARGGPTPLMERGVEALAFRACRVARREGVAALAKKALRRLTRRNKNHHTFRPHIDDLTHWLMHAGYSIEFVHWTAPPYEGSVYLLCERSAPGGSDRGVRA